MNDATKQALNDFLVQAIDAAKTGASWTAEQTPLLVQEWLRWYALESAVLLGLSLFLVLLFVVTGRLCWKQHQRDRYGDWNIGACICWGVSLLLFVIPVTLNTLNLVKVWAAPRVVVAEQFAHWLK